MLVSYCCENDSFAVRRFISATSTVTTTSATSNTKIEKIFEERDTNLFTFHGTECEIEHARTDLHLKLHSYIS